jgi:hypothetical protein
MERKATITAIAFVKALVLFFILALCCIIWQFGDVLWLSAQPQNWHSAFDICVHWMENNCHYLGMDYKEFNIFLFVILHPIITLLSIFLNIYLFFRKK